MVSSLVIGLREGLEAALVIGILLAYLARIGRSDRAGSVWLGTGLAILASLLAGGIIFLTASELEGLSEALFEGVTLVLAVAVLAY